MACGSLLVACSIAHSSLVQISPESQSLLTVQLSPGVASASGTSRNVRSRMMNTPVFFMDLIRGCGL